MGIEVEVSRKLYINPAQFSSIERFRAAESKIQKTPNSKLYSNVRGLPGKEIGKAARKFIYYSHEKGIFVRQCLCACVPLSLSLTLFLFRTACETKKRRREKAFHKRT